MLMGWNALAAFAAVVFTVLSFIGQPRLRRRMRAGAVSSVSVSLPHWIDFVVILNMYRFLSGRPGAPGARVWRPHCRRPPKSFACGRGHDLTSQIAGAYRKIGGLGRGGLGSAPDTAALEMWRRPR